MKELLEIQQIKCNSQIELVECAKFLVRSGFKVANFNGQNFISKYDSGKWIGMSFNYEEETWGRFFTNRIHGEIIEFKYLIRKDKLKQLNEKKNLNN